MTPVNRLHDVADVPSGNDDLVGQDARRLLRDAPAGVADEPGDEQRGQRVEERIAPPDAEQRAEHGDRS